MFDSSPESNEEAARIDGAGNFRRFRSIVLPMATLTLVTIFILSSQGSWHELGHFIVTRQSQDLNTLTVRVAQLVSGTLGAGNQFPLQRAAAVLMSIPVAVLFFIVQRRVVNSAEGAEKVLVVVWCSPGRLLGQWPVRQLSESSRVHVPGATRATFLATWPSIADAAASTTIEEPSYAERGALECNLRALLIEDAHVARRSADW